MHSPQLAAWHFWYKIVTSFVFHSISHLCTLHYRSEVATHSAHPQKSHTLYNEHDEKRRNSFLRLDLLLDNVLEGDGVGGKLGDTLTQLLDGHLVLVEVEAEEGLIADVALLLEVEARRGGGVELLGDGLLGLEELVQQVGLWRVSLFDPFSDASACNEAGKGERTEMVR